MGYDEGLNIRVEEILSSRIDYRSKKMFGGICYLLNGNMLAGIIKNDLIIRTGKDRYEELLQIRNTKVLDITGKIMKSWIMIEPEGIDDEEKLQSWLAIGINYVASLCVK